MTRKGVTKQAGEHTRFKQLTKEEALKNCMDARHLLLEVMDDEKMSTSEYHSIWLKINAVEEKIKEE